MQHTTHSIFMPLKKICACVLAAVLAVVLMPLPAAQQAYATPLDDKQAEAEAALANLNAMQQELDRLSAAYGEADLERQQAESNRDAAQERINEINKQIGTLQTRLSDRAREMYRGGNTTFLDMILGAKSFEEFATNLDFMNKVNENDANLVAERKVLREESEEQIKIYNEQARVATEKAEECSRAADEAQSTVNEMQAIYDGLNEEVAELVEQQRAAEEAAAAAQAAAAVAASASGDVTYGGYEESASAVGSYNPSEDTTPVQAYEGGSDVVSRAYACLGAPYVWGAVGPYGYDCSGLVSYCLSGSHTRLGTTGTFIGWPQVSDPQPGDVCVIHEAYGSQHTGIYIGGGQMIHAATYGVGVIIGPVQSGMIIVRQP